MQYISLQYKKSVPYLEPRRFSEVMSTLEAYSWPTARYPANMRNVGTLINKKMTGYSRYHLPNTGRYVPRYPSTEPRV